MSPLILWDTLDLPLTPWDTPNVSLEPTWTQWTSPLARDQASKHIIQQQIGYLYWQDNCYVSQSWRPETHSGGLKYSVMKYKVTKMMS